MTEKIDWIEWCKELKPCPFCGNKKIMMMTQPNFFLVDGTNGWYPFCGQCGAKVGAGE